MFEKDLIIKATELVELKKNVKAELSRRNLKGNISTYSGVAYDFTIIPEKDKVVNIEHYEKIRTPVAAINPANLPPSVIGDGKLPALNTLDGSLTLYKSFTGKTATTHGCAASCSGLCFNSCTSCSGCTGCWGDCEGFCSGCGSGCASSCEGCTGCSEGCSGGCRDMCSVACRGDCAAACRDDCYNGCSGCSGCGGNCTGCSGGCTSCSGSCSGNFML